MSCFLDHGARALGRALVLRSPAAGLVHQTELLEIAPTLRPLLRTRSTTSALYSG